MSSNQIKTTIPMVGSKWIFPISGKVVTVLAVRERSTTWNVWHSGRPETSLTPKEWSAIGLLPWGEHGSE